MAIIKNTWVGYLERSYATVKASLLSRLGRLVPEMSDHSESNIMVVVLDAVAGVVESLNYYIDNMARETFISTARRYSSAVKLSRIVDYRIKSRIPASVDLLMEFFGPDGSPAGIQNDYLFNKDYHSFEDPTTGMIFTLSENVTALAGSTSVVLPLKQAVVVNSYSLGKAKGIKNEIVELPDEYGYNSVDIFMNSSEYWKRVDTMAFSTNNPLSDGRHHTVEVSATKKSYIQFGDGINGSIPTAGMDIVAYNMYLTKGAAGNIGSNRITKAIIDYTGSFGPNVNSVKVTNKLASVGGSDVESLDDLKKSIPLSVRTLNRAVTRQDYVDIAELAPGVAAADVEYVCGDPYIKIYVYPKGGGIAQYQLLIDTFGFFYDKKMFPTQINTYPAGVSKFYIEANITGKVGRKSNYISEQVQSAIEERYNQDIQYINKTVRKSDIIALIDNQESVDFLDLKVLRVIPFLNPMGGYLGSNNQTYFAYVLPAIILPLDEPVSDTHFIIKYVQSTNQYTLLKHYTVESPLVVNTQYTQVDNLFKITVPNLSFPIDLSWEFYIYANNNGDILLKDHSVPVFDWSLSTLTITEV